MYVSMCNSASKQNKEHFCQKKKYMGNQWAWACFKVNCRLRLHWLDSQRVCIYRPIGRINFKTSRPRIVFYSPRFRKRPKCVKAHSTEPTKNFWRETHSLFPPFLLPNQNHFPFSPSNLSLTLSFLSLSLAMASDSSPANFNGKLSLSLNLCL